MSETGQEVLTLAIVDDDADVRKSARIVLRAFNAKRGIRLRIVEASHPSALDDAHPEPDLILLDMNFKPGATSGEEGLEWLKKLTSGFPEAVVIAMSAYGEVETAVEAVRRGAHDFVVKPWENEKLRATVGIAAELVVRSRDSADMATKTDALSRELDAHFGEIVGNSEAIEKVVRLIEKYGATDADVLIQGENGTGKELVARALHRVSKRSDKVFVPVDMGAISGQLFESELFGHVKGAFTGANAPRAGRFEAANGGTLFLDEIANLPFELQPRLLRAIETREVVRVGSNDGRPTDIRLITASNRPLADEVAAGRFREDLLYRLNGLVIELPPLRDRGDDVILLAEFFLKTSAKRLGKGELALDTDAREALRAYRWPGNVRELQNAIERAAILADRGVVTPHDLGVRRERSNVAKETAANGELPTFNLEELERRAVEQALEQSDGVVSKAAAQLGVSRAALYRKMEKFGLG